MRYIYAYLLPSDPGAHIPLGPIVWFVSIDGVCVLEVVGAVALACLAAVPVLTRTEQSGIVINIPIRLLLISVQSYIVIHTTLSNGGRYLSRIGSDGDTRREEAYDHRHTQ